MKLQIPDNIRSITPYPPGKPIEELEREYGIGGSIKLASNENPLGPSPMAVRAMRSALTDVHRYPDGSGYYLTKALAEQIGFDSEQIVLGNGSNEIIEFLVKAFVEPGDVLLFHGHILHSACGGVTLPHPRRAHASMWAGPDVHYVHRRGQVVPDPKALYALRPQDGQRLSEFPDVFPIAWSP